MGFQKILLSLHQRKMNTAWVNKTFFFWNVITPYFNVSPVDLWPLIKLIVSLQVVMIDFGIASWMNESETVVDSTSKLKPGFLFYQMIIQIYHLSSHGTGNGDLSSTAIRQHHQITSPTSTTSDRILKINKNSNSKSNFKRL